LSITLLPFLALAQFIVPGSIIVAPVQIIELIDKILVWIGRIVLVIAVIMLLYAAILYLTAGSSETIHTKAKSVLIYAIVGIVVALLAYSIIPFITVILQRAF